MIDWERFSSCSSVVLGPPFAVYTDLRHDQDQGLPAPDVLSERLVDVVEIPTDVEYPTGARENGVHVIRNGRRWPTKTPDHHNARSVWLQIQLEQSVQTVAQFDS